MAITFVTGSGASNYPGSSSSYTITINNVQVGDIMVVGVTNQGSTPTVTCTGESFSIAGAATTNTGVRSALYTAKAAGAGNKVVTIAHSAEDTGSIGCAFRGCDGTTWVDQTNGAAITSSGTAQASIDPIANAAVIGYFGDETSVTGTLTDSQSATLVAWLSTHYSRMNYKIETTDPPLTAYGFTTTGTFSSTAVRVLSLKPAAGSSSTSNVKGAIHHYKQVGAM